MSWTTADLHDAHEGAVQVTDLEWVRLGRRARFAGPIATLKVHEDNPMVRAALEEPGEGRVLLVDGGGSRRCALVGDKLAGFGADNGWAGIVVFGCVRDRVAIDALDIGVRCLGTTPKRSAKHGFGERDVRVSFGGVTFDPGAWLYADEDGLLVAASPIHGDESP